MPSVRSNVLPETTASHTGCNSQYSLNVQNIEGRMDTCVGCRIVEYLLSTVFLLCIGLRPQVRAFEKIKALRFISGVVEKREHNHI